MKTDDLHSIQAPLKERYKQEPAAALRAKGHLDEGITGKGQIGQAPVEG